jgi:16S rRNA (guanine966-N2)-methyltransferase
VTRIIGGRSKGRRLKTPGGLTTRPTAARVRQSLFDILAPRLPGCRFLDAFAGTGAVGLEAFSRGAGAVVLVDSSSAAIASIRENARAMGPGGGVRILRQDTLVAMAALADRGERFDVIYLDPPYDSDLCLRSLWLVASSDLLAPGGVAVAERFHKGPLPATIGRLARMRSLRIGDHVLSLYDSRHEESSPS